MELPRAKIGVFGGSGLYALMEGAQEVPIDTPYAHPSGFITVGEISGKSVAFLPRHGRKHQYPPHMVNFRANLWAFKQLGVRQIIGPCAAGSLQPHVKVGDFVISDQLVDRTTTRVTSFYDGPATTHVSFAEPYCPRMRELAIEACKRAGVTAHPKGTVVVVEGPRFSTKAESRWYSSMGWEVINMTQFPEALLARELEMCYVNIAMITDYDSGLEGRPDIQPVTNDEVLRVFRENLEKLKKIIAELIALLPDEPPDDQCPCPTALKGAVFG
ncbi:MAG: S-methyl-5'-thioadenosine phosphorylase [bacterium]|jgi:5'-methylthioadenosine phosphorylase